MVQADAMSTLFVDDLLLSAATSRMSIAEHNNN